MLRTHVLFEVAELGKLTVAVYNLTLELFLLDLLEISILNFKSVWVETRICTLTLQDCLSCRSLFDTFEKILPQNLHGTGALLGLLGSMEVLRLVSASFIFFLAGEAPASASPCPRLTRLLSASFGITRGCPLFPLNLTS